MTVQPGNPASAQRWEADRVIRTVDLTKRFGTLTAVDALNLDVRRGDIYGFLGANGSGKTTTVRMLLGLVLATSGSVQLLDKPIPAKAAEVLQSVGALVEGPAAYGHLSGASNLTLHDASGVNTDRASRRQRVRDAMELVGLGAVGKRPVKAYSLGMRQRLGLGAALLRSPKLLILDEPTNGLDPQGISEIRILLRQLNAAGTTVFLSSHLLAEVEQLCTRVGVLDRGRLVLQEELSVLTAPTGNTIIRTPDVARAAGLLEDRVLNRTGDQLVVAGIDPAELNSYLVGQGLRIYDLRIERPTLEQRVLQVSSRGGDRVDSEMTPVRR